MQRINANVCGMPKYRYNVLVGEARERLKDILAELCEWQEITIRERANKGDHVHRYLSVPPKNLLPYDNEDTQGEKCRVPDVGVSGVSEEILEYAYLGERILCKHSVIQRRGDSGIRKKTVRGEIKEKQRRSIHIFCAITKMHFPSVRIGSNSSC